MPASLHAQAPTHVGPRLYDHARSQESCHRLCLSIGDILVQGRLALLLHSGGDSRDRAAVGCRDVSHAVKRCRRLLALGMHPGRLCLGTGCCSSLETYSLGVS